MAINPELAAATEIARLLKFPSVIKIDAFAKGRVELMKFIIPNNSVLDNMQVYEVAPRLHCSILICAVERGADVIIPGGNFRLQKGDKISFVASSSQASEFFRQVGISNTTVKTAMLVGGGKIITFISCVRKPGPSVGKLVPRVRTTAKILYLICLFITVCNSLLPASPLFDSMAASFGTAGTGGFGIVNSGGDYTSASTVDLYHFS